MRLLAILVTNLLVVNGALAQSGSKTIKGSVIDELGAPLPLVNVFLAGTTIGTTTDLNGEFELNVEELGAYELVARFVGFKTFSKSFILDSESQLRFKIKLVVETTDLGGVVVIDKKDKEWKENLKLFKKYFLGETRNSYQTKILNESDINFFFNESKNRLEAYCADPIIIRNNGLGYEISYFLEEFVLDYKKDIVKYEGFTLFKDSKPGNSEKRKFIKQRERAYNGSVQHFFSSLYNNKVLDEGWLVSFMDSVENGNPVNPTYADLARFVKKNDQRVTKTLAFDKYLLLFYVNETYTREYIRYASADELISDRSLQSSWIRIFDNEDGIEFQKNGYVLTPTSFIRKGYWGFEKISDALPSNYRPLVEDSN